MNIMLETTFEDASHTVNGYNTIQAFAVVPGCRLINERPGFVIKVSVLDCDMHTPLIASYYGNKTYDTHDEAVTTIKKIVLNDYKRILCLNEF